PEDAGATLHCDVVIGSALVYSPHHACVADVLSRMFSDGGCRAAYVVQLSTRQAKPCGGWLAPWQPRTPGFDDFLRRLGSCGLRYRLHRIAGVLPAEVLEEIRLVVSATIVGGPVKSRDSDTQTSQACAGNGGGGDGSESEGGVIAGLGEAAAGGAGTVAPASGPQAVRVSTSSCFAECFAP
ncbi:unnamed protein product, partial [Hapterophycus canaliculatus]